MNKVVKVLVTVVLVLLLAVCAIAIVGALNHGPGEEIIVGRFVGVCVGALVAIAGLVKIWRKRAPVA